MTKHIDRCHRPRAPVRVEVGFIVRLVAENVTKSPIVNSLETSISFPNCISRFVLESENGVHSEITDASPPTSWIEVML
jgi:hypothetical protein